MPGTQEAAKKMRAMNRLKPSPRTVRIFAPRKPKRRTTISIERKQTHEKRMPASKARKSTGRLMLLLANRFMPTRDKKKEATTREGTLRINSFVSTKKDLNRFTIVLLVFYFEDG